MQTHANRHANLPQRMGRWGGHVQIRVPESRDSESLCSSEQKPGIPKYILAQSLGLPSLPESQLCHSIPSDCLWSDPRSLRGWGRAWYGPEGASFLLLFPGCTAKCPPAPNHCVCLWMARKGLWLPISRDCSVHPKLGLSPSKGPREWSAQERWPPLWALLLLPAMPSTQKILDNK